nr:MAG TPA: hypothetical protein [Caudoviricetes sp.]
MHGIFCIRIWLSLLEIRSWYSAYLYFIIFLFFLIWLSIKKRRIPGLNIG